MAMLELLLSGMDSISTLLSGVAEADRWYWLYEISEDVEFFKQSKRADNVPILLLLGLLAFYLYLSFKQAFRNDRLIHRLERNPGMAAVHHRKWDPYHKSWPKKLHVWPYLLRIEFVGALIVFAFMMVWALLIQAPLEEPSNPAFTPNPSKAPWYFLGLQELLVYFDPWIAGVILPGVIVVGLMAIPYIDVNNKGNGYYTWSQRKFAIFTFLFGFVVLWVGTVFLGTYMRGPGWQLFWPWQAWDAHRVIHEVNLDLNELLTRWGLFNIPNAPSGLPETTAESVPGQIIQTIGVLATQKATIFGFFAFHIIFGGMLAASWFSFKKMNPEMHEKLSTVQLVTLHLLNAGMYFVVLKIILRLGLTVKYIWVIPGVLNI